MPLSDLSLVVPVYNEADNMPALFEAVEKDIGTDAEILICYDFDEDNTLPAVRERMSKFPNLRLVKNQYGRGPLGAIKSGFSAGTKPAVIVVMADLSDDLSCVPQMLQLFQQGCRVVAGSRYMKGGKQIGGPFVKKMLSRLAGASLHYLVRLGTRDATNSFRLYSKEYLQSVEIESDGGFELGLELTVKAHLRGLKVGEVPCTWTDRVAGKSRFQLKKWLPKYMRWYWHAVRGSWFTPKHGKPTATS
ncbi:MAG TPA: glycosyltransferase [Armatimonadota bacterium]|nr:glycosyltransferase [Armatimonadota bacterium]